MNLFILSPLMPEIDKHTIGGKQGDYEAQIANKIFSEINVRSKIVLQEKVSQSQVELDLQRSTA